MNRTNLGLAIVAVLSLVANAVQFNMLDEAELEIAEHHAHMTAMNDEIIWHRSEPEVINLSVYADKEVIEALLRDQGTNDWQYNFIPFYLPEGAEIDPFDPGCPDENWGGAVSADENELLEHVIDPSEGIPIDDHGRFGTRWVP